VKASKLFLCAASLLRFLLQLRQVRRDGASSTPMRKLSDKSLSVAVEEEL
jgi:hypothetical protein